MKFALDYTAEVGDDVLASATLLEQLDQHRETLTDVSAIDGGLSLVLDGKAAEADYSDPLLRLVDGWLRKVPWVIAGDTETVALRNSEHCFAFVPAGDGVEVSFFEGDEAEIEEYIIAPTNVRLEEFAAESMKLGQRVLDMIKQIDPDLLTSNEDCKDLAASLDEASKAWHDYEVHQRR